MLLLCMLEVGKLFLSIGDLYVVTHGYLHKIGNVYLAAMHDTSHARIKRVSRIIDLPFYCHIFTYDLSERELSGNFILFIYCNEKFNKFGRGPIYLK